MQRFTVVSHYPTTARDIWVAGEQRGCRAENGKIGDKERNSFDRGGRFIPHKRDT